MMSLLGTSVVFWCKGFGTVRTDVVVDVVVVEAVVVLNVVVVVVVVVVALVVELTAGTVEGVAAKSNNQGGRALGVVAGV